MKKYRAIVPLFLFILIGLWGCGPLLSPMVIRLDEKNQANFDLLWNEALNPIDRLDRLQMLDLAMGGQLHQLGETELKTPLIEEVP